MNVNKIFLGCSNSHKKSRSNKKHLSKTFISILVVFLFLALPLNASIVPSAAIVTEENEDDCPLCAQATSEEEIYFSDLSKDEQIGLVTLAILYTKFESDVVYFDSLNGNKRQEYLNSLVQMENLLGFHDSIENYAIKNRICRVIDVVQGNNLPFEQNEVYTYYYVAPSSSNYLYYHPTICNNYISVFLKNIMSNIVEPALKILGCTIKDIIIPTILTLVEKIIEVTPYPRIVALGTIFGVVWETGVWFKEVVLPIIIFIIENPVLAISWTLCVTFYTVWILLILRAIICFFGCPGSSLSNNINRLYSLKSFYLRLVYILNVIKSNKKTIKIGSESSIDETSFISVLYDNNKPTIDFSGPLLKKNLYINKEQHFLVYAQDSDGDDIYFNMDWGDGKNTGWRLYDDVKEGIELSHTWFNAGTYTVTALAKDDPDKNGDLFDGLESDPCEKEYNFKIQITSITHSGVLNKFSATNLFTYVKSLLTLQYTIHI